MPRLTATSIGHSGTSYLIIPLTACPLRRLCNVRDLKGQNDDVSSTVSLQRRCYRVSRRASYLTADESEISGTLLGSFALSTEPHTVYKNLATQWQRITADSTNGWHSWKRYGPKLRVYLAKLGEYLRFRLQYDSAHRLFSIHTSNEESSDGLNIGVFDTRSHVRELIVVPNLPTLVAKVGTVATASGKWGNGAFHNSLGLNAIGTICKETETYLPGLQVESKTEEELRSQVLAL
ncbi:hypothetical protein ACRALDRAFT_207013 [Sodiomyces alcalophilus JCM 7366]|uniref:uncharacterized protein n=1 Tax=Sodiomyces alcalophilus JCM 7366 TaxID=591952 RepID=UPI0039B36584